MLILIICTELQRAMDTRVIKARGQYEYEARQSPR
jgi:hypothetical protein